MRTINKTVTEGYAKISRIRADIDLIDGCELAVTETVCDSEGNPLRTEQVGTHLDIATLSTFIDLPSLVLAIEQWRASEVGGTVDPVA